MLQRKPIFPNVIEVNFQAGQVLGCNVYVVFDGDEWVMIDIGYEETVEEIIELVRQIDFPLSQCKTLIATHAGRGPHPRPGQGEAIAQNQRHRAPVGGAVRWNRATD